MSDRPILFSGPMVRAILDGRKTMTRRVVNPQPKLAPHHEPVRVEKRGERGWVWMVHTDRPAYQFGTGDWRSPYAVGDRLYVREAWHAARSLDITRPRDIPRDADIEHAATARSYAEIGLKGKLRPAMFLPRWASRITLTVTDVRVQWLQDISRDDAIAEGLALASNHIEEFWRWPEPMHERLWLSPIAAYRDLWDSLNDKPSRPGCAWRDNPWIVAITFNPIFKNIDQVSHD